MKLLYSYGVWFVMKVYVDQALTLSEWQKILWLSPTFLMAFGMRLVLEYQKRELDKRNLLIQTSLTITYCYLSLLAWNEFFSHWSNTRLHIYTFINTLFAVFFVSKGVAIFQRNFFSVILPNIWKGFVGAADFKPEVKEEGEKRHDI